MGMGLGIKPSLTPFSNNHYLEFDGTDDRVSLDTQTDYGTELSISVWVKYEDTGINGIMGNTTGGSGNYEYVSVNANYFKLSNSQNQVLTSDSSYNIGTWYHIVWTIEDDSQEIFIDSASDGTSSIGITKFELGEIGRMAANNSYCFNGSLDEIAIFNKILTQSEITQLYGDGTPETCGDMTKVSGLVSGWRCEEGTGTTAADIKGNNDGTLTNGVSWGTY